MTTTDAYPRQKAFTASGGEDAAIFGNNNIYYNMFWSSGSSVTTYAW